MADPRAAAGGLQGTGRRKTYKIDNSTITYTSTVAGGSSQVGLMCTIKSDDTIELVGDGEAIEGKILAVTEDDFAIVQVDGPMEVPGGSGATLTRGKKIVGDLGAASAEGYVREVAEATAAELAVARGRIIDPSTTTAVVVEL